MKKNKTINPFTIQSGRFKDGQINKFNKSSWFEDVFIFDKKEREMVGNSFNPGKLKILSAFFIFLLLFLLGKSAWLQIVKGDYYYSVAEGNRVRIERIEPKRGVIYDRFGRPLVRNRANFMLYFIPADISKDEKERNLIFNKLGLILEDLSASDLSAKYNSVSQKSLDPQKSLEAYQPLFVVDNIGYEKAMKLYLLSDFWPGIVLSNRTNRDYLVYGLENESEQADYFLSMSHIMGYTGKINKTELEQFGEEYLAIDYIGKMGIEYFWENELKGKSGRKQIEVDALGKQKKIIGIVEPEDGNNLVLSLDVMAQIKLEEILNKHLKELNLAKASAIVMDPENGEILSMVSLPAYNNNAFARGISHEEYNVLVNHPYNPLFNRSISGEYPSGSTIKPLISAAALEEGIISEHTSFLSVGGLRIGEWFFPDWLAGGHGRTNVRKAIAQSVNTFFYYIGGGYEDFRGLGVDRIVEYGRLFGLGAQMGIDLAGESSGFLPTREWKENYKNEPWYIGDTYHLAIGQGDLLVTPLQVAVFTSVFANSGKLYRPHFIKEILSSDDKVIRISENEPVRKDFIDPYNIHVVRQGMRQTVTSGSARSMQTVPVEVAGKTGTAQWSSKHETHAWFTGFAPYDNPELVITVLIEQGGEGSSVAVPIAKEFLQWYFGEYKNEE
ncbi:penicillin-binding protein 2 [Candidatus Parcubacteria bacterium]|nr:penicillin-binding protein 2 [Candidatus Parcubacteria bacterium]